MDDANFDNYLKENVYNLYLTHQHFHPCIFFMRKTMNIIVVFYKIDHIWSYTLSLYLS